mmetsp:Transcript_6132/g.10145  ORF Transcript_6132/g.10145 Transcript_6132/m.10145 type:complete len:188 (+) Transcript_6132:127-690(+)|eukprot:CAMPEP_0196132898 /NCGR_PEP_ID=MMETSP0910-20130528/2335_1 /TAXON_ID=49265 /ORGANISM="Thalassiosira rotula, Strain GSO102" /LENGTH=187 /DNA_ID=CAMNT_0041392549 /DNA_START=93 /DNA_END=656 /DNA_ORIENTATION=+
MSPSNSKSDFPPEEAYRRSKVSRFFDLVDLNKDGTVEEDDFIEWGRQAAYGAGVEYTPELADYWKNCFGVYFADNAGCDKEKYLQAMIYWSNMDNPVAMAVEVNTPLMKAIDTNGDGVVSYEEFYAFLKPLGTENSAREAFDLIDLDGSGTLDAKEFAEACARYFCDKEESPYENVFGKFRTSSDGN